MTMDDIVAELLAAPLRDFTARRGARARGLKAAGQRDLAGQVTALKKPPVALWAADQVVGRDRAALDRLRRAGQTVVEAQAAAAAGRTHAAPALRQASSELQRELEGAVRVAADALRADGHAADEATRRRVQEILRVAAVSGGEAWERLRRGSLLTEPRAGEDMLTAAFGRGVPPAPGSPPTRTLPLERGGRSKGEGDKTRSAERAAARAAARDAQRADQRLEAEHAARTAKLDAERAREASDTARRLREQADAMTADARRAAGRARQAEREAARAAARAKVSEAAVQRVRPSS